MSFSELKIKNKKGFLRKYLERFDPTKWQFFDFQKVARKSSMKSSMKK